MESTKILSIALPWAFVASKAKDALGSGPEPLLLLQDGEPVIAPGPWNWTYAKFPLMPILVTTSEPTVYPASAGDGTAIVPTETIPAKMELITRAWCMSLLRADPCMFAT